MGRNARQGRKLPVFACENEAIPSGFFGTPKWSMLMMWLMRIWLLSNRMEPDDDRVAFALRDRTSLAFGACAILAFFMAL